MTFPPPLSPDSVASLQAFLRVVLFSSLGLLGLACLAGFYRSRSRRKRDCAASRALKKWFLK